MLTALVRIDRIHKGQIRTIIDADGLLRIFFDQFGLAVLEKRLIQSFDMFGNIVPGSKFIVGIDLGTPAFEVFRVLNDIRYAKILK